MPCRKCQQKTPECWGLSLFFFLLLVENCWLQVDWWMHPRCFFDILSALFRKYIELKERLYNFAVLHTWIRRWKSAPQPHFSVFPYQPPFSKLCVLIYFCWRTYSISLNLRTTLLDTLHTFVDWDPSGLNVGLLSCHLLLKSYRRLNFQAAYSKHIG